MLVPSCCQYWDGSTYLREAVPVEYDSMEELSKRQRLQHPATEPPRPVPLTAVPGAPDEALCLAEVPPVFERAEQRVDGDGDTQLLRRVDAQGQPGERGAHGRGVGRCERRRCPGISYPERLDLRVEKVQPQACEEAEQPPVQQEDGRQRQR